MAKVFSTMEDLTIALNIFCRVYGTGTLGMPGNFSRSGPVLGVLGVAFMAFANVYASVTICRVMLLAPTSVITYIDLGEWCMGKWGQWLAVVSQTATCLLDPCVLLVLGGTLLDGFFPDAFTTSYWICCEMEKQKSPRRWVVLIRMCYRVQDARVRHEVVPQGDCLK